ncbi:MAG: signal peptide peptidase SppA [Desulfobacteraceae bacterium]|nr:signal peptide peptidase SppA [Desulfobacteraceae bacterium]
MSRFRNFYLLLLIAGFLLNGCMFPTVKLFTDASDPLKEFVIEGDEEGKVLMIPVFGIISDIPSRGIIFTQPSMVQDIVSQLRLAEKDPEIKAVLFKIDSPGGSVTASDILYHEIKSFKERTGVKVASVIMNVAASGGYYMALPSDLIVSHPTSMTGSVGVIFLQPKFYELMDKIGVGVSANTSGKNKDMGSPFRETTDAEEKIFQSLTDSLGKRFIDLVVAHRQISPEAVKDVASARIYLADEALALGLIDEIGYIDDAISRTKEMADLDENCQVIVYRRVEYPDDNLYNTQARAASMNSPLIDLGLPDTSFLNRAGFYYLWPSGVDKN